MEDSIPLSINTEKVAAEIPSAIPFHISLQMMSPVNQHAPLVKYKQSIQTFGEKKSSMQAHDKNSMQEEFVGNQTPNLYQTTDENEQRDNFIEINPESNSVPLSVDEEKLRVILMEKIDLRDQTEEMQLMCLEHIEGFYYNKNDKLQQINEATVKSSESTNTAFSNLKELTTSQPTIADNNHLQKPFQSAVSSAFQQAALIAQTNLLDLVKNS